MRFQSPCRLGRRLGFAVPRPDSSRDANETWTEAGDHCPFFVFSHFHLLISGGLFATDTSPTVSPSSTVILASFAQRTASAIRLRHFASAFHQRLQCTRRVRLQTGRPSTTASPLHFDSYTPQYSPVAFAFNMSDSEDDQPLRGT